MSPARRERILEAKGRVCARLDCDETHGLEIDHIIPIALGGKDRDDNLEPLCRADHAIKTKRDVAMIAKAKRLEKPRKPSRMKSRPFPKGSRPIPSRKFRQ
jgi:5-methylcytosine-specific restriction endonuclease McrA